MIYRPQFACLTPPGCRDLDFVYYFDGSNTPNLNQNISGLVIPYIPLVLDQDAPFFWRGIKLGADRETNSGTLAPDPYAIPNWSVQFRDCYDNPLSDDYVPATQYGFPSNPWTINNAKLTGPPALLECSSYDPENPEYTGWGIYCPPGGTIQLFINVPALSGGDNHFLSVALMGVKRYKECL